MTPASPVRYPTRGQRLLVAALVGLASAAVAFALIGRPGYDSDFYHFWWAARITLSGGDPYALPTPGPLNPGNLHFLYPYPAALLLLPFAKTSLALGGALFVGSGSAAAAWAISRDGWYRFPIFLSAPFLLTLSLGQWSPWIVAAALTPALAPFLVAKPNVGLAAWFARPSRTAVYVGLATLVVSLVVRPTWPAEWLPMMTGRDEKFIPILRPGGFLLLSALLSWRTPEGRLLAAMSVVPQALFFYDQLVLWLIPKTLRQSILLSLWSVVAFIAWDRLLRPGDLYVQKGVPYAYSQYFAALAIVLYNWRKSRGATPADHPSVSDRIG